MTYHGILADMEALEDAVESLPNQCLYHGDKIDWSEIDWSSIDLGFTPDNYDGACCQSGQPALYRRRAEAALQRLRENL